jgi:hypothetical protein
MHVELCIEDESGSIRRTKGRRERSPKQAGVAELCGHERRQARYIGDQR